jgi:hypothetical protein
MKEEQHDRAGKVREQRNEKVNTIKIDSIVIYALNRSWPFIFIGWGGLAPQENPFTSLIYQDSSIWLGIGGTGQTCHGHRSDRCTRCANLVEGVSPPSRLWFGCSTYEF